MDPPTDRCTCDRPTPSNQRPPTARRPGDAQPPARPVAPGDEGRAGDDADGDDADARRSDPPRPAATGRSNRAQPDRRPHDPHGAREGLHPLPCRHRDAGALKGEGSRGHAVRGAEAGTRRMFQGEEGPVEFSLRFPGFRYAEFAFRLTLLQAAIASGRRPRHSLLLFFRKPYTIYVLSASDDACPSVSALSN